MTDFDVIVCGLGPVGQLLSLLLGDRGVRTLALDREHEPYALPRAAVIDDEVLRILQAVGLDREVLADAQVQPGASIVTADGRAVEILRSRTGPLGHPPLVSINQPSMERTMLAALATRTTVETRRDTVLDALDRRADEVDVYVRATGGGRSERITTRWLVGCDGAGSSVRTRLGIPFEGRTAPQRWIVVDALVSRPLQRVPHPHFVGARERPTVTLPMSPGRHRWEWMLRPGEDAAPLLAPNALEAAVAEWLTSDETADIERAVVYTFHTRTAERWRQGRVLLAGDAAHVMPPFAGQGFSSGARDASNLAWKLADVIDGAPATLLDTYEQERRPHVAAMQRLATSVGGAVQATGTRRIAVRDTLLNAFDGSMLQQWAVSNVKPLPTCRSGAFASRPSLLPVRRTTGTLFPQTQRLDDRLGTGWAAVSIDDVASSLLREAGLPVVDPEADGDWLVQRSLTWAILRPDRFVFACGIADQVEAACASWRAIAPPASASSGLPSTADSATTRITPAEAAA